MNKIQYYSVLLSTALMIQIGCSDEEAAIQDTAPTGGSTTGGVMSMDPVGGTPAGGSMGDPVGGSMDPMGGSMDPMGGTPAGGEMMGGSMTGGEVAGGEVAGGEVAGGEVAGGEVAGGEVAGGEAAGGEVAGGEVAGGEVATETPDAGPAPVKDDGGCQATPRSSSIGLLLLFLNKLRLFPSFLLKPLKKFPLVEILSFLLYIQHSYSICCFYQQH